MDKIEHNGENFMYVVQWDCIDPMCQSDSKKYSGRREITNHNKREIIIEEQLTYKKYRVRMFCKNDIEVSSAATVVTYGYSGEDGE
jgi:hypothetical protein